MPTLAPTVEPRRTLALGRGWVLPAALAALYLVAVYLPAHGVSGLTGLWAAAVAALGVLAASVAAPRLVRGLLAARPGPLVLIGSGLELDNGPAAPPARQIAAIVAGAAVSAGLTAVSAALLASGDPTSPGHAVTAIALFVNAGLLLSNVVPVPHWPGWTLLLALLGRHTPTDDRIGRAVPIARAAIVSEAALIASVAVSAPDWMLLVLAGWLVWYGWIQTAMARADDVIGRYLAARRLDQLAREVSVTVAPDEPVTLAARRRDSNHALIAVMEGGGVVGIMGPRQLAMPSMQQRGTCAAAMVPVERLTLLSPDAPATAALPQLERHGFALLRGSAALRGVEVGDVLNRLLMTAAVADAVRRHPSRPTSREQDETSSPARPR